MIGSVLAVWLKKHWMVIVPRIIREAMAQAWAVPQVQVVRAGIMAQVQAISEPLQAALIAIL